VKNAFSIAISSKYIICSCAEGIIRLFEPVSLKYICILPKPHPLGVDVSLITSPDMLKVADDTCYPDVTALAYDERSQRITAVYSDRSLYVWDIRDLDKVGKYRSFLFHSDCVWGIEVRILVQSPVGNDFFL
jgi:WD40 repeat protein